MHGNCWKMGRSSFFIRDCGTEILRDYEKNVLQIMAPLSISKHI